MQANRIINILYYLMDKGPTPASELARELNLTARTVYRYVNALNAAGIPVYATDERNSIIYLQDNFVLDDIEFPEPERQKIIEALQVFALVGSYSESELLSKLSSAFRTHAMSCFEMDFSQWGSKKRDSQKFEDFRQAILRTKTVRITYINSFGQENEAEIYPLKLCYQSKEWYLKAYCTPQAEFQLFKFNCILDYTVLAAEFEPVSFPDIDPNNPVQSLHKIVLHFSWEMAYRVYDEFDLSQIERQEDGGFLVTVHLPLDAWLVGQLLSFGAHVDVLEPASLRTILSNEAEKIVQKYQT